MRSRPLPRRPKEICACGNVCTCHHPKKESWEVWAACIFGMLLVFGGPILLGYCIDKYPPANDHKVIFEGRNCILRPITDNCTSTGACSSHDEVICPK